MNSSKHDTENISEAINLNRQMAKHITDLKRRCFDYKVIGPIELSQRSMGSPAYNPTLQNINNLLVISHEDQETVLKQLSSRLNIQGLTIEQFLTGRIDISENELITLMINKLRYPNQYAARRAARLIFQLTVFDCEHRREIDDIVFEMKSRLSYNGYHRSVGKGLFDKKGLAMRNTFYHKIMSKRPIGYHRMIQFLDSQGLDTHQMQQLMSYILEISTQSTFSHFELRHLLIKEQSPRAPGQVVAGKNNDRYQKKESILTKSSDDRDGFRTGSKGEEIYFLDCQIQVVETHVEHNCGIYSHH